MRVVSLVGLILAGVGGLAWWIARPGADIDRGPTLSVARTLAGTDTAGFARADSVVRLRFPADHGAHPDFRTEWWYVTGNLESEDGRRFGYQLTLFRNALAPRRDEGPPSPSAWATRQAWMGHFTVTDVEAGRFYAYERFEREALGLAGVEVEPLGVWVGPWRIDGEPGAEPDPFPLRLRAGNDSVSVELRLARGKGIVLQGEAGLSRKGPEPGNASYYYSMPRLPSDGRVTTPAGRFTVSGASWLDREWSTSGLSEGLVGWDWFALQLDDGRDLMIYGLRDGRGIFSAYSEGLLVAEDGSGRRLRRSDFQIEEQGRWSSPVDGAAYPSGWRLTVPDARIDVVVTPVLRDQELDLTFRYWEGAVDVEGHGAGPNPELSGLGYVELTGYAGEGRPRTGTR